MSLAHYQPDIYAQIFTGECAKIELFPFFQQPEYKDDREKDN